MSLQLFGDLAAGLLLQRLDRTKATSGKLIIDHLVRPQREALFSSLIEIAERQITIPMSERSVKLRALVGNYLDVLPILVVDAADVQERPNTGTEAFASALRDFFANNTSRPRALVTLTARGNETQRSASDSAADKDLLTRRTLAEHLFRKRNVVEGDCRWDVLDPVINADDKQGVAWELTLARLAAFLEAAADLPDNEVGRHLPALGVFFSDSSAEWNGEVKVQGRTKPRLEYNAQTLSEVTEIFRDPLRDARETLNEEFDQKTAKQLFETGAGSLSTLDLDTLERRDKASKGKNAFDLDCLEVDGARLHQLVRGQETEPILALSSDGSVTVRLPFAGRLREKEYVHLVGWDPAKSKPKAKVKVSKFTDDRHAVEVTVPEASTGFEVWRLIISRGPRSYKRWIDVLWIATYRANTPRLAIELGCQLSLERQAWQHPNTRAAFEIHAVDCDPVIEHVQRESQSNEDADDESLAGDEVVSWAQLGEGDTELGVRIHWLPTEEEALSEEDERIHKMLELAPYGRWSFDLHKDLCSAFQPPQRRYLEGVTRVSRQERSWLVQMGDFRLLVERWNKGREESAVARVLSSPRTRALRLERYTGEDRWEEEPYLADVAAELEPFLTAREALFSELNEACANQRWTERGRRVSPVTLLLLDLEGHEAAITHYLDTWLHANDLLIQRGATFSDAHRALLQTDILEEYDDHQQLARLTVLPTHPWLLAAALRFQQLMATDFQAMNPSPKKKFGLQLSAAEVHQLAHPGPVDLWYFGSESARLRRVDGPPFHWSFLPESAFRQVGGFHYLSRVVRNKINRYLQMHRHLQDGRRTLRLGFINPGDGHHLFEGIFQWLKDDYLKSKNSPDAGDHIPTVEVLLFSNDGHAELLGTAFDDFFRSTLGTAMEDEPTQLLLQKLRYRKNSLKDWPRRPDDDSLDDYVHICFFRGLVKDDTYKERDHKVDDGWDGCFADGLLATPLRETRRLGKDLRTEYGVWLAERSEGLRRGLAHLQVLLRGHHGGIVDPDLASYMGATLPSLEDVAGVYQSCDWVVHLDRALGLDLFRQFERDARDQGLDESPTVIEYTDQEDPEVPGFDTITVTRYARPYFEQLENVLKFAGLEMNHRDEAQKRAGKQLIQDINILSGTWAIDFILGNVGNSSWNNRLKGNVGSALVYRWLERVERQCLRERHGNSIVPLCLSLEELIRATPSAGFPLKDGLFRRFSNENEPKDRDEEKLRRICDDLLVLYLTPSVEGQPSRIFGRVIEVKFASNPSGLANKAIDQVRETNKLLTSLLSGAADRRDAPFRHKQLSMLIKSRIEQARIMGLADPEQLERLKLNVLSANLAAGRYTVDYTIGVDGTHLHGDVFLLSSGQEGDQPGKVKSRLEGGVRIVEVMRDTLEWLAFQDEDSATLYGAPTDTVPDLGQYGEGPKHQSSAASINAKPPPLPTTPKPQPAQAPKLVEVSSNVPAASTHQQPPSGTSNSPTAVSGEISTKPTQPEHQSSTAALEATELPSFDEALKTPVKVPTYSRDEVRSVVSRLQRTLDGHKIKLDIAPSVEETDLGPRLVRVHVRLEPGQSIQSVRRISEDLARDVGTSSPDVHVCNVPERHAIGVDLPIEGLGYTVTFDELTTHASFNLASTELSLPFCAGIDVTGRPVWVDLASMPHALVAGTTGSGKTVFLRQVLLTLLLHHAPDALSIRLSSSKPMDFKPFEKVSHAKGQKIADSKEGALNLVRDLAAEMDRRIRVISNAACDNLAEFNDEVSASDRLPYLVAVIDEYSETVLSFSDRSARTEFENLVARLAQKSRAAGIHMILCMQRPDSAVIQGPIKANILHRFALKLPQNHDSRVILDESGAEALLGQGDLLYKDASGRTTRLQVPNLEKKSLKSVLKSLRSDG